MKNLVLLAFFTNMLLTNVLFANTISLTSDEAKLGSVAQGETDYYKINASSGDTVTVLLDGLSNDADLHLRIGAEPTSAIYDCKSTNGGINNDICSVTLTNDNDVYINVDGFRTANYQVTASVEGAGNNGGGNENDLNISSSVIQGETKFYTVSVVAGQTVNTILNGLNADADLYVKVGAKPAGDSYDCKSTNGGNNSEACSVLVNEDTTVHIAVYGYRAANYTLTATILGDDIPTLTSAEMVAGIVARGTIKYYKISGQLADKVTATISSLTADADIYIKRGSKPTTSLFDCKSTNGEVNSDSCSIELLEDEDVYIGVYGFRTADYNLIVTSARELIPANPAIPTVLEDAESGTLNPNWITARGDKPGYIFPTPHIDGAPSGTGVMVHHANGQGDSLYRYELPINITSQRVLSMDMGGLPNHKFDNYSESYRGYIPHSSVGVIVETRLGRRFMNWDSWYTHQGYSPRRDDNGHNVFLKYPAPVEMVRGWYAPTTLWTHFKVNLDDELHRLEPNNEIIRITQFFTTGGYLDNITLSQAE